MSIEISNELNPGVSAINPLFTSNNSTNLVVCFPLPKAYDISFTSKFKFSSNKFKIVLLPTPLWPVITVILFFNASNSFYFDFLY